MLTLEELEARDFILSERDDLVLAQPSPLKNLKRNAWKSEELMYRSAVIDRNTNQIVSLGFPKFFNYGEGGPSHIENSKMRKGLASGEVTMTEKIDGSLAIRYVHNGVVKWRTRGTLNDTPHTEAIKDTAAKYPILANPGWGTQVSLLFEFVSPEFQIVLRYPEPELYLIGAIHTIYPFDLFDHKSLDIFGDIIQCPRPKTYTFNGATDIENILAAISEWKGSEGVVAQVNRNLLLKLKSSDYLLRHRLKEHFTVDNIRQVCIDNDIRSMDDFEKWLEAQGADWEIVEDSRPLIEIFMDTRMRAVWAHALLMTDVRVAHAQWEDRGDFARNFANDLPVVQKGPAFMLLDADLTGDPEKRNKAWSMLLKNMLDEAYKGIAIIEKSATIVA